MAINLTINGVVFAYPEQGDSPPWGAEATGWATAATGGMLQKAGGVFTLLAETDFGPTAGIKALYLKSRTPNLANGGMIRLAPSDIIAWRDNGNTIDLTLGINGSDQLTFNAVPIQVGQVTNANIDNNTIDRAKLINGTASRAMETDGSGIITDSAITSTELNNLSGITSNIQGQFDALPNQFIDVSGISGSNNGVTIQNIVFNSTGRRILIYTTVVIIIASDISGRISVNLNIAQDFSASFLIGGNYKFDQDGFTPSSNQTITLTNTVTAIPTVGNHNYTAKYEMIVGAFVSQTSSFLIQEIS